MISYTQNFLVSCDQFSEIIRQRECQLGYKPFERTLSAHVRDAFILDQARLTGLVEEFNACVPSVFSPLKLPVRLALIASCFTGLARAVESEPIGLPLTLAMISSILLSLRYDYLDNRCQAIVGEVENQVMVYKSARRADNTHAETIRELYHS